MLGGYQIKIRIQGLVMPVLAVLAFLLTQAAYSADGNFETPGATQGLSTQQIPMHQGSFVLTYKQSSDVFRHPPQQSSGSLPVPYEQEEEDVNENGDEDDGYKMYFIPYQVDGHAVVPTKISIVQLSLAALNRAKISLVVLHHSWKSFLS